ncbi:MAG: cytochrome c oxidase assembly protein [Chloroflexi bacterium]|nr:cytochrome c oxidase assembly protein [Chloroflexota bacterium]MDA1002494.1 cytochrome c oxidase assembly protein [Chloroflexota bacterium]
MAVISLPALIQATAPAHNALNSDLPLWANWSFDPQFLIPVAIAAWFYVHGLRRWDTRSREHPWWRTALYFIGLALLVIAIESPIDRLAEHYLAFHMLQHELLMTLAVPVILLGAPTTPSLRGMPRWLRLGVIRPLARRQGVRVAYGWLTHPVVAIGAMTVVLLSWHITPGWYDASITNALVHDVQHLSLAGAAILFWWNVIDPRPRRSRLAYIPRVLYVFVTGVPRQFLGAMLTFADRPTYEVYREASGPLSLSPADDQQLGGLIMWVLGGMMYLLIMGIIFGVWAHKSEQAQRASEAVAERARAAARVQNEA